MTSKQLKDFANKVKESFENKEIRCPVHMPGGNEEQLVELFKKIRRSDYVFSTHRNIFHALLHGVQPERILRNLKEQGTTTTTGAGGMCTVDYDRHFFASAIVGGNTAMAVGVAWALKDKGSKKHVWCFIGDGAIDTGHFWEAFQYAEGWDLPVTFVVENNDRSTCTSIAERLGDNSLVTHIMLQKHTNKVIWYDFKATHDHVGTGKYVAF